MLATQEEHCSGSVGCDFKEFCCVGWLWLYVKSHRAVGMGLAGPNLDQE
jgi:hypothetical protein